MKSEILKNILLIKSPNSEIREGAFSNLTSLFSNTPLSLEEKTHFLDLICSHEFLFYGINEGVSDHTVARSFSLLVIGLILDSDKTFEIEVNKITSPLLKYIQLETDFRSKDDRIGWIHTLAHLGDVLAFFAYHKKSTIESVEFLCKAIIEKVFHLKNLTVTDGEDVRIGLGLFYAFEEKLGKSNNVIKLLLDTHKDNINVDKIFNILKLEVSKSQNKVLIDRFKNL